MQEPVCEFYNLGLMPYEPVWRLQDKLAAEIASGRRPPTLLLLEHTHTYTFGRRGHMDNLIWDEEDLIRRGIRVHWVDRGGDVTYHGPGQLVGYPLLPLDTSGLLPDPAQNSGRVPQADYVGYVRKLEATLIDSLAVWGVHAQSIAGLTGVWVRDEARANQDTVRDQSLLLEKVAAIGVKVDVRGITRHGFALNVNPDMSYWQGIIACGLDGYGVTSLEKLLDPTPAIESVIETVVTSFGKIFGYNMLPAKDTVAL